MTKNPIDPHRLAARILPMLNPLDLSFDSGRWTGLYSAGSATGMRTRYAKTEVRRSSVARCALPLMTRMKPNARSPRDWCGRYCWRCPGFSIPAPTA